MLTTAIRRESARVWVRGPRWTGSPGVLGADLRKETQDMSFEKKNGVMRNPWGLLVQKSFPKLCW